VPYLVSGACSYDDGPLGVLFSNVYVCDVWPFSIYKEFEDDALMESEEDDGDTDDELGMCMGSVKSVQVSFM